MNTRIIIIIACLLLAPAVRSMANDSAGGLPNAICPVDPTEAAEPDIFVTYEGQTIHLCCNRCRKKFLADPTAYLDGLPQFAPDGAHAPVKPEPAATSAAPHDHGDHGDDAAEPAAVEHDHATGHGKANGVARLAKFLGKFHPLVVHFPIALILTAALAEALSIWTKRPFFEQAARFAIILGALGALAAAPLGWMAAGAANYLGELTRVLLLHRWIGVSAAGVSVIAAALALCTGSKPRLTSAYRIALLVSAVLVGLAGHFGATLIYGTDYFAWSAL